MNAYTQSDAHQYEVARTWLKRDCFILPCHPRDKAAVVAGFGANEPPEALAKFADPQQVDEWWSPDGGRYRGFHVGILCGPSGLVAVDIDHHPDAPLMRGEWEGCRDGHDVWATILDRAGTTWPTTYQVRTPSGGLHLVFRHPDGPPIGNAKGIDGASAIGPSIDVRGWGGYVIAAGSYSRHQSRPYHREGDCLSPQPTPAWLTNILRKPSKALHTPPPGPRGVNVVPRAEVSAAKGYVAAAVRGEIEKVSSIPPVEGSGWNNTVYKAAFALGTLLSAGLDRSEAESALLSAALHSRPGRERAAKATIRSGLDAGERCPRQIGGAA